MASEVHELLLTGPRYWNVTCARGSSLLLPSEKVIQSVISTMRWRTAGVRGAYSRAGERPIAGVTPSTAPPVAGGGRYRARRPRKARRSWQVNGKEVDEDEDENCVSTERSRGYHQPLPAPAPRPLLPSLLPRLPLPPLPPEPEPDHSWARRPTRQLRHFLTRSLPPLQSINSLFLQMYVYVYIYVKTMYVFMYIRIWSIVRDLWASNTPHMLRGTNKYVNIQLKDRENEWAVYRKQIPYCWRINVALWWAY